jgi:hypothetical protein
VDWFIKQAGKTEIPDFYLATGRYHDVRWFEISVQDPVGVKVLTAV